MIENLIYSLSKETGMGQTDVRRVLFTAPKRYKVYIIPKRSGGTRTIAHPAKELKVLQRAFLELVLDKLPVHETATAYRKGKSLLDNVAPHAGDGPILKMDFRNFFPSIRGKDWTTYCSAKGIFESASDIDLSAKLLFRREKNDSALRLSIGAPTSPSLSNILMFTFDAKIFEMVSEQFVSYTRYADDLTFSAQRTGYLTGVQTIVAMTIRDMNFPRLEINSDKTRLVTSKFHRDVTGLTLSTDGRVTLGQLRKRNIRAGVHNYLQNKLTPREAKVLAGHIAFAKNVEPQYFERLGIKYGADLIRNIMKTAHYDPKTD